MFDDPLFYAVTIPAVLLIGISKSGFGAGFGSLAVPLIALSVPVPQAAAILMPILLAVDLLGLAAFRKNFDKSLLRFMLPFGLLGTLVGTMLYKLMDAKLVAGIVGVCTLLFLAQRLLFLPKAGSKPPPPWMGAVLTTLSGFTSFIAHAGGPPINAYTIPLRLAPVVYTATMAYFFFVMNLSKWIPYAWLGLFDKRNLLTSLALLPLAPVGVWLGLRIGKRISPLAFYRIVYWGMFLTGCKLVWDSFR